MVALLFTSVSLMEMMFVLCRLAIILQHVRSLRVQELPHQVRDWKLIPIGIPYDFDDFYRDDAAIEDAEAQFVENSIQETNNIHFFTDADCSIFTSKHVCAEVRQHQTYLATYPCSGNTWTRAVLEGSLLIYTGSVFCDGNLKKSGMLGECMQDASKVFPIKTHWPVMGTHTEGHLERNLVIVREPLQATLSYTTFSHGGGHFKEMSKEVLQQAFDRDAKRHLQEWAHMANVIRNRKDVHVVRYEDIVANTSHSYLTDIFPYLGVDAGNPNVFLRLSKAIERSNHAYNTTRRKHSYIFEFTDGHKELAREIIGEDLAGHYGYQL